MKKFIFNSFFLFFLIGLSSLNGTNIRRKFQQALAIKDEKTALDLVDSLKDYYKSAGQVHLFNKDYSNFKETFGYTIEDAQKRLAKAHHLLTRQLNIELQKKVLQASGDQTDDDDNAELPQDVNIEASQEEKYQYLKVHQDEIIEQIISSAWELKKQGNEINDKTIILLLKNIIKSELIGIDIGETLTEIRDYILTQTQSIDSVDALEQAIMAECRDKEKVYDNSLFTENITLFFNERQREEIEEIKKNLIEYEDYDSSLDDLDEYDCYEILETIVNATFYKIEINSSIKKLRNQILKKYKAENVIRGIIKLHYDVIKKTKKRITDEYASLNIGTEADDE